LSNLSEKDILGFISSTLLDGRSLAADDDLLLSGTLDSLGVMTVVAFLEKQMGKSIPAPDITIENFASVEAISSYVKSL
jgi:acyl carrier protein